MNQNQNATRYGLSFSSALTLLFIGLRLTDVIHWSWLWVLSPMWISFLLFVVVVCILAWLMK